MAEDRGTMQYEDLELVIERIIRLRQTKSLTAKQISKEVKMSQGLVYGILNELQRHGVATQIRRAPGTLERAKAIIKRKYGK